MLAAARPVTCRSGGLRGLWLGIPSQERLRRYSDPISLLKIVLSAQAPDGVGEGVGSLIS